MITATALVSLCVAAALAVGGPLPAIAAAPTPSPAPASTAPAPVPAPAPAPAPSEATPAQPTPASDPAAALSQPTDPASTWIELQPAPAPTVAPAPTPAPSPPPPRPVVIPPAADALVITGAIAIGLGGASLLFVSGPAAIVRNTALRRAEREHVLAFSTRKQRYDRARRADDVMEGAFWIGVPLLVTGTALLITGLVIRSNARNRSRMAAVPGGLSIRF